MNSPAAIPCYSRPAERGAPHEREHHQQGTASGGLRGRQTGHGFRHLLSTELNSRGYNRDWIERQLAHGDKDEIRGTYNHATYLEQRRGMMQAWADSIDALCSGANVLSLKRQA